MADETTTEEKNETDVEAAPATETTAPAAEAPAADKGGLPAASDTAQAGVDESVEVPEEFKKLVEQVEKMSVLELHELVKVLEKRFGVSAAAVAVAAPGAGGGEGGAAEQDSFAVELTAAGAQKIAVIKVVKEVLGLGLKEAKDMVDGAPAIVKEGAKKEEAEELKAKLEEAGATVTLK